MHYHSVHSPALLASYPLYHYSVYSAIGLVFLARRSHHHGSSGSYHLRGLFLERTHLYPTSPIPQDPLSLPRL